MKQYKTYKDFTDLALELKERLLGFCPLVEDECKMILQKMGGSNITTMDVIVTEEILECVMASHISDFKYIINNAYEHYKDSISKVLSRDGMLLQYVDFRYPQLCEIALRNNPNSIVYVPDNTIDSILFGGLSTESERLEYRRAKRLYMGFDYRSDHDDQYLEKLISDDGETIKYISTDTSKFNEFAISKDIKNILHIHNPSISLWNKVLSPYKDDEFGTLYMSCRCRYTLDITKTVLNTCPLNLIYTPLRILAKYLQELPEEDLNIFIDYVSLQAGVSKHVKEYRDKRREIISNNIHIAMDSNTKKESVEAMKKKEENKVIKKTTKEEYIKAIRKNPEIIMYADSLDADLYKEAVKLDGDLLEYVPEDIRMKYDICKLAIENNPFALEHVSPDVKHYNDLCITAIESKPISIVFAQKLTYNLIKLAVESDYDVLSKFSEDELKALIEHENKPDAYLDELYKVAVDGNGTLLEIVPSHRINVFMCLLAVRNTPIAIQFVPDEFKDDEDILCALASSLTLLNDNVTRDIILPYLNESQLNILQTQYNEMIGYTVAEE